MRRHLAPICLIALAIAVLFARLTAAHFCGFDDFREAHRAAIEDTRDPAGMLTKIHFVPFMYRPAGRILTYATWHLSHHDALAFRLRNLLTHILAAAFVYGIAFLMARSRRIALASGLLFGLSPLANQTVAVAVWTNTTAYAFALGSFFFFAYALRRQETQRGWGVWLAASLLCFFVAIFIYEPTIVLAGLMAGYLVLRWSRAVPASTAFLAALAGGIAGQLIFFFGVRHVIITGSAPPAPLGIMLRNAVMYCTALIVPFDFVLANTLFGTPLPSELHLGPRQVAVGLALVVALAVLGALLARNAALKARVRAFDWPLILFLIFGSVLAIVPSLLFRDHPSEQNLYLPEALYAILLSLVIWQAVLSKAGFAAVVALLVLLSAAGTAARNERVIACGAIAERIFAGLPLDRWQAGTRHILLATPPGVQLPAHYGIYNYRGLLTLEVADSHIKGAQFAIQLATLNTGNAVDIVDPSEMAKDCRIPETCFLVSASGDVTSFRR
jgi:hypothetical protein